MRSISSLQLLRNLVFLLPLTPSLYSQPSPSPGGGPVPHPVKYVQTIKVRSNSVPVPVFANMSGYLVRIMLVNTGRHDLLVNMATEAGKPCEQLPSAGKLIPGEMLYLHADLMCLISVSSPGHNGTLRLSVEQGDEMILPPVN